MKKTLKLNNIVQGIYIRLKTMCRIFDHGISWFSSLGFLLFKVSNLFFPFKVSNLFCLRTNRHPVCPSATLCTALKMSRPTSSGAASSARQRMTMPRLVSCDASSTTISTSSSCVLHTATLSRLPCHSFSCHSIILSIGTMKRKRAKQNNFACLIPPLAVNQIFSTLAEVDSYSSKCWIMLVFILCELRSGQFCSTNTI